MKKVKFHWPDSCSDSPDSDYKNFKLEKYLLSIDRISRDILNLNIAQKNNREWLGFNFKLGFHYQEGKMKRLRVLVVISVFSLLGIFSACQQIDPVELLSRLKGEQAEQATRLTAKIIGIRMGAHKVQVKNNVMVAMRDGLKLATDIYQPLPIGKYPVITCRLPYEKKKWSAIGYVLASNGYVFVIQDCRSTGESEGKNFIPVLSDYWDGHDLIHWIKEQPFYNGKIGAWGASFLGRTQWLVSDSKDMACLYPQFTSTSFASGYRGGANLHEAVITWASRTGHHIGRIEGKSRKEINEIIQEQIFSSGYYNAPMNEPWRVKPEEIAGKSLEETLKILSEKFGEELSWNGASYSEAILEKLRDLLFSEGIAEATMGYKDRMDLYRNLKSPVLLVSGWYDVHNPATMEDFANIKKYARGEAQRYSKIMVGPWAHIMPGRHDAPRGKDRGGQSFSAYRAVFVFDWWDYWLKGIDNEFIHSPPVHIYVMGKNYWRYENEWPLARTQWTKFYLHSQGNANSVNGDGWLSIEPPQDEPSDQFDYDPNNPVLTMGGAKLLPPSGSLDQREAESRNDVLVYSSEVLKEDLEITGPLTAIIYASSSAKDTDFTAKLVEVYPDGKAILINQGIIRARFRQGKDNPSLIEPGKIYRYEISLWCTSNVFLKGHRIRVELSSSNFPEYDRNANLGGEQREPIIAHQTIYHNRDYPSHLLLPVIPDEGEKN